MLSNVIVHSDLGSFNCVLSIILYLAFLVFLVSVSYLMFALGKDTMQDYECTKKIADRYREPKR